MASVITTGLLALAGKYFNDNGKQPRNRKRVRQSVPEDERPSGKNVYHSDRLLESEYAVQNEARKQYAKSCDPVSTNVIPPLFNTMQEEKLDKFHSKNKQQQIFKGAMFENSVVEGLDRSTTNTLTGQPMEQYHENMVPFHGLKHNPDTGGRMNEGKLERFTGHGEIIERPKQTIERFFPLKPQDIRNTTFAPDDLREERYVPALTNNKTNLLPVPQVRQAAYDALDFRPSLENFTVESRRVKSNPKISFAARTVDGIAQSETVHAPIGHVKKNRPATVHPDGISYSNPGAAHSGRQKIPDNYLLRYTNKEQLLENRFNGANASATGNRTSMRKSSNGVRDHSALDSNVRESFKSEVVAPLDNLPMSAPNKSGLKRFDDKAKITLRQLRHVQRKGNVGNGVIQDSMGHVLQHDRTHARSTHRETSTLRNYRGAGGAPVNASADRSYVTGGACISDKKELLLENRMPGRGRANFYHGTDTHGDLQYRSGTSDVPGYSNRYIKTDNRHGAGNDFKNYGYITRVTDKKSPDCLDRMDDIDAIVSQLDTNSLVIRNDV